MARNMYSIVLSDNTVTSMKTLRTTGTGKKSPCLVIDSITGLMTHSAAGNGQVVIYKDDGSTLVEKFGSFNAGSTTIASTFNTIFPVDGHRIIDANGQPIDFKVSTDNTPKVQLVPTSGTIGGATVITISYHIEE